MPAWHRRLTRRGVLGLGLGIIALPALAACGDNLPARSAVSAPTPTGPIPAPTSLASSTAAATTPASAAASPSPAAATGATGAATAPATIASTGATTPAATPAAGTAVTTPAASAGAPGATQPGAAGSAATAGATQPAAATKPAAVAPTSTATGKTLAILAPWGVEEKDPFLAVARPVEEQASTRVSIETSNDVNEALASRIRAGTPPDLVVLPGPGYLARYAREGKLVDLAGALDAAAMRAQYGEDWLKLGQAEGKTVGVIAKTALKSTVWYSPPAFKKGGFDKPTTWAELLELSRRMAGSGTAPWSIGLAPQETTAGAERQSGWPGSDWIEDLVLRQAGPDVYDRWLQGKQKWSSPEIRAAWEAWGQIVGDPKMVLGGRQTAISTTFIDAAKPLFSDPPRAYMQHQGSFMASFIARVNPKFKPGDDFDFFPFPAVETRGGDATIVTVDLLAVVRDSASARALVKHVASADGQTAWVKQSGFLSPNKQVAPETYPDKLARAAARRMVEAKTVRFDGSDMMPLPMSSAFLRGVLEFVEKPTALDSILATLDKAQVDAYR